MLNVYPINSEKPFRLDFFGDTLEKMRSGGVEIDKLSVVMTSDVVINESEVNSITERLKQSLKKYGQLISGQKARTLYDKLLDKLK